MKSRLCVPCALTSPWMLFVSRCGEREETEWGTLRSGQTGGGGKRGGGDGPGAARPQLRPCSAGREQQAGWG